MLRAMKWKAIATACLIVGVLPLIIYPGVLIAGIMGLAAPVRGEFGASVVLGRTAMLGSLAYPVVWLPALVATVVLFVAKKNERLAAFVSASPLAYLLLVGLVFLGWYVASSGS